MLEKLNDTFFIAVEKNRQIVLKEGEVVDVRIISRLDGGNAKISLRGFLFVAKTPEHILKGKTIKMKVSFQNEKLILTPILKTFSDTGDSLSQVSVFKNPSLVNSILKSFAENGLILTENQLDKIYHLIETSLKSFHDKEKLTENEKAFLRERFRFLAVALYDKGFVSKDLISKVYRKLFQDNFKKENKKNQNKKNSEKDKNLLEEQNNLLENQVLKNNQKNFENDILKLINHTKGKSSLNWILIPFSKNLDEKINVCGSLAFLINLKTKTCLKTVMRANIKSLNFIFEIKNNSCNFYFEDNRKITEAEKNKLIKLLQTKMQDFGLNYKCSFGKTDIKLKSVDLKV